MKSVIFVGLLVLASLRAYAEPPKAFNFQVDHADDRSRKDDKAIFDFDETLKESSTQNPMETSAWIMLGVMSSIFAGALWIAIYGRKNRDDL